jgi:hypothetical protein
MAAEFNTVATVRVLGDFITIYSPVHGELYGKKAISLDVIVEEQVKALYAKINKGRWRKLCRNCDKYSATRIFRERKNNLTIRARTYGGKRYYKSVLFDVDSTPPRIHRVYPQRKGYGLFGIKYSELHLENVTLFYGPSLENAVEFKNCTSGKRVKCYDFVNISEYNGMRIYYRFLLKDHFRSSYSRIKKIKVEVKRSSSVTSLAIAQRRRVSDSVIRKIISFFKDFFGL